MLEKLKSRKFILASLGVISGIATALSGVGGTVGLIASITVIIASTVTYIVTEGKIDKAAIDLTYDSIVKIIELIKQAEKEKQVEDKTLKYSTTNSATVDFKTDDFIPKKINDEIMESIKSVIERR